MANVGFVAVTFVLALLHCGLSLGDQGPGVAEGNTGRPFRVSGDRILVDRFEIRSAIQGDLLTFSLDTDLGDAAIVYVEISRLYRPPGHSSAYPVKYFSESSTVGKWRQSQVLRLDDKQWSLELESRRKSLRVLERKLAEQHISDDVLVRFTVPPYHQPYPVQAGNANLEGRAVDIEWSARIVTRTVSIRHPISDQRDWIGQ